MHLPTSIPSEIREAFNELHSMLPHVRFAARDITRWKMAWRACRYHKHDGSGDTSTPSSTCYRKLLARRCTDGPEWHRIFKLPTILGFAVAAFIYGGLHALAWSAHFDSLTEKVLWRISSCIVMGGLLVNWTLASGDNRHSRNLAKGHVGIGIGKFPISLPLARLMLVLYILARAYLVVECFTNVFYLPAGVFENPEWSTYFPHIS